MDGFLIYVFYFHDAAIGFNVETVQYNNIKFQVWDLGMMIDLFELCSQLVLASFLDAISWSKGKFSWVKFKLIILYVLSFCGQCYGIEWFSF